MSPAPACHRSRCHRVRSTRQPSAFHRRNRSRNIRPSQSKAGTAGSNAPPRASDRGAAPRSHVNLPMPDIRSTHASGSRFHASHHSTSASRNGAVATSVGKCASTSSSARASFSMNRRARSSSRASRCDVPDARPAMGARDRQIPATSTSTSPHPMTHASLRLWRPVMASRPGSASCLTAHRSPQNRQAHVPCIDFVGVFP